MQSSLAGIFDCGIGLLIALTKVIRVYTLRVPSPAPPPPMAWSFRNLRETLCMFGGLKTNQQTRTTGPRGGCIYPTVPCHARHQTNLPRIILQNLPTVLNASSLREFNCPALNPFRLCSAASSGMSTTAFTFGLGGPRGRADPKQQRRMATCAGRLRRKEHVLYLNPR